MESDLKVSIIVPNYNHEAYLKQRLDSIFDQTYRNYEVILLDDASTDNSVEILNIYKGHPKVSNFIINEKNSGSPFKQWKKGIKLAKGEYIWIAESDDWAEINFLEECIKTIENFEVDLVVVKSKLIKEDKILSISGKPEYYYNVKVQGNELIAQTWLGRNIIENASAVVFANTKIPDLDEICSFKLNGDWLFWILYSHKKSLAFIDQALNNYRYHEKNVRAKEAFNNTNWFESARLYYILFRKKILEKRSARKLYLISYIKMMQKNINPSWEEELSCMNRDFSISNWSIIIAKVRLFVVVRLIQWRRKFA